MNASVWNFYARNGECMKRARARERKRQEWPRSGNRKLLMIVCDCIAAKTQN